MATLRDTIPRGSQPAPVATGESEQKGTHAYDFEKAAHLVRRGGERLDRGCFSEFQRSESRIRLVGVTQEALLFVVVFAQPRTALFASRLAVRSGWLTGVVGRYFLNSRWRGEPPQGEVGPDRRRRRLPTYQCA
jgi:hypothetical protein